MSVPLRRARATAPAEVCQTPCFNRRLVARIKATLPSHSYLTAETALLQALSDRTRLTILFALAPGHELCVCDLAHVLSLSVSATSHQLRQLRHLGLVDYRNDGRMVYYSLAVPELIRWLGQGRKLLSTPSPAKAVGVRR